MLDKLHLSLPHDAIPLLTQVDQDNFRGDGYRLQVFQLSAAGQESIMQQRFFASWSKLPVESALQEQLQSRLEVNDLTQWADFAGKQGFYIVLSRNYDYVLSDANTVGQKNQEQRAALKLDDDLWWNITFAVLDTQTHQLMIYTWDA